MSPHRLQTRSHNPPTPPNRSHIAKDLRFVWGLGFAGKLGIRPEGKRGSASMPPFLNAYLTMDWFRRLGSPSRCGRKCKPLTCQETRFGSMAVAGLAPSREGR
eukprot:4179706-Amphidinium_carterae.1